MVQLKLVANLSFNFTQILSQLKNHFVIYNIKLYEFSQSLFINIVSNISGPELPKNLFVKIKAHK